MIAPLRNTNDPRQANVRLLSRARRAVAAALLHGGAMPMRGQTPLRVWLFAGWTVLVAAAACSMLFGYGRIVPY